MVTWSNQTCSSHVIRKGHALSHTCDLSQSSEVLLNPLPVLSLACHEWTHFQNHRLDLPPYIHHLVSTCFLPLPRSSLSGPVTLWTCNLLPSGLSVKAFPEASLFWSLFSRALLPVPFSLMPTSEPNISLASPRDSALSHMDISSFLKGKQPLAVHLKEA